MVCSCASKQAAPRAGFFVWPSIGAATSAWAPHATSAVYTWRIDVQARNGSIIGQKHRQGVFARNLNVPTSLVSQGARRAPPDRHRCQVAVAGEAQGSPGNRVNKRRETKDVAVTESSGTVFADLGFAEPEEELTRRNSRATSARSWSVGASPRLPRRHCWASINRRSLRCLTGV